MTPTPLLARFRAVLTGDARRAREQQLLRYLTDHPYSTGLDLCRGLSWGPGRLYPLVEHLVDQGRVAVLSKADVNARRCYRIALTSPTPPAPPAQAKHRALRVMQHCADHSDVRVFGPCHCHRATREAR
jgi:predicted metal-dependent enzyme (double-stranded beta helix superfamily)